VACDVFLGFYIETWFHSENSDKHANLPGRPHCNILLCIVLTFTIEMSVSCWLYLLLVLSHII